MILLRAQCSMLPSRPNNRQKPGYASGMFSLFSTQRPMPRPTERILQPDKGETVNPEKQISQCSKEGPAARQWSHVSRHGQHLVWDAEEHLGSFIELLLFIEILKCTLAEAGRSSGPRLSDHQLFARHHGTAYADDVIEFVRGEILANWPITESDLQSRLAERWDEYLKESGPPEPAPRKAFVEDWMRTNSIAFRDPAQPPVS